MTLAVHHLDIVDEPGSQAAYVIGPLYEGEHHGVDAPNLREENFLPDSTRHLLESDVKPYTPYTALALTRGAEDHWHKAIMHLKFFGIHGTAHGTVPLIISRLTTLEQHPMSWREGLSFLMNTRPTFGAILDHDLGKYLTAHIGLNAPWTHASHPDDGPAQPARYPLMAHHPVYNPA